MLFLLSSSSRLSPSSPSLSSSMLLRSSPLSPSVILAIAIVVITTVIVLCHPVPPAEAEGRWCDVCRPGAVLWQAERGPDASASLTPHDPRAHQTAAPVREHGVRRHRSVLPEEKRSEASRGRWEGRHARGGSREGQTRRGGRACCCLPSCHAQRSDFGEGGRRRREQWRQERRGREQRLQNVGLLIHLCLVVRVRVLYFCFLFLLLWSIDCPSVASCRIQGGELIVCHCGFSLSFFFFFWRVHVCIWFCVQGFSCRLYEIFPLFVCLSFLVNLISYPGDQSFWSSFHGEHHDHQAFWPDFRGFRHIDTRSVA